MPTDRNVFGTELEPCSSDPLTGYLRDGCCRNVEADLGRHEVCAVMTEEFLSFSTTQGNDLVTPEPQFDFPGLEPGDRWCLCLGRWLQAKAADSAPPIVLESTNESVLDALEPDVLREYEYERDRLFESDGGLQADADYGLASDHESDADHENGQ